MARAKALLPGGPRLSDHLSIGLLACVYPRDAVNAALATSGRTSERRRELPAEVAVYFVIALGLFRSCSAREVLRCLAEGLRRIDGGEGFRIPGKGAISRARQRLGSEPFEVLRRTQVKPLGQPETPGCWFRGLRLVALDGSTLDMPDEEDNRSRFGLPGSTRGSPAFPRARLSVLVEVGTRAALAWQHGPCAEAEMRQAERLVSHLSKGMLVLADRYYCGFPLWRKARATGADLLWRVKTNMRFPVLKEYSDGSYRSRLCGSGRDRNRSKGTRSVRVIEYTLPGRDEVYRLATTLSPKQATAHELAALYHERWEVENAYDEIKTHLLAPGPAGSTALRSKTPELVSQEIDGTLLAHYAIRSLLHAAAKKSQEDPDRLSFAHAVQVIRRRLQKPCAFPP